MTDLESAVAGLKEGFSVCLCRKGETVKRKGRGIAPLIELYDSGENFESYSAADLIVGKAAAMIFKKLGVSAVYGEVMSEKGKAFLEQSGIEASFGALTEKIINRDGTDICPMEKTVAEIENAGEGIKKLKEKLAQLRKQ